MADAEDRFYASHSRSTDPGPFGKLIHGCSANAADVVRTVPGLVLHRLFAERRHVKTPEESKDDVETRAVSEMVRRVLDRDPGPLTSARRPEQRLIGVCSHYALLACSIMRHHGVPSRLRVGFASYFGSELHTDHWLCEYWDGHIWRLADAELDAETRNRNGITFEPWDVPRDRFFTAGQAWHGVQAGNLDPMKFGVHGFVGAWFIAGSVVRDLAALNKHEMLPWDYWGIARDFSPEHPISTDVSARIDAIARLIAPDPPDWKQVTAGYREDSSVQVPDVVRSFPYGAPIDVKLSRSYDSGVRAMSSRHSKVVLHD